MIRACQTSGFSPLPPAPAAPLGQLLKRPPVAVRVGEVDEAAPRLLVHLAGLDPALEQLGADGVGVGHDHHQVVQGPGRHLGQTLAERDRAAGPGRGHLDEAEVLADRVVVVGVEPDRQVELLGPVDVGDRDRHQLESHLHDRSLGPPYRQSVRKAVRRCCGASRPRTREVRRARSAPRAHGSSTPSAPAAPAVRPA